MRDNVRRAGAPSTMRPTRRRGGPSLRCLATPSKPMKPPDSLRSFPRTVLGSVILKVRQSIIAYQ